MAKANTLLDFFDQRYFESACAGKVTYPSRAAAETVALMYHSNRIRHYRAKMPQDFWLELSTYFCGFCGSYHMGHG